MADGTHLSQLQESIKECHDGLTQQHTFNVQQQTFNSTVD
jgi:hypothetical protein